jgi:dolichol kinase
VALSIIETFGAKRFLLNETGLRKVIELIATRLNKGEADPRIQYELTRQDRSEYKTKSIEEVLSDRNTGPTRLQNLKVYVNFGGVGTRVALFFDVRKENVPVFFSITGDDREMVMLLGADLREYIVSEIIVKRKPIRWIAIPLAIIWYYLMRFFITLPQPRPASPALPSASEILKNPDLAAKLNYLIQRQQADSGGSLFDGLVAVLFLAGIVTALWILVANPQWKYIVPGNLFLIGKERERYDRLIDIRDKVVWGVIVAFIVGIVAGVIVWRTTSP